MRILRMGSAIGLAFVLPWNVWAETSSNDAVDRHQAPTVVQLAAREPEVPSRPYGYGFFAGGRCNHDFTVLAGGGGAEGFPRGRLGIGVDGGYYHFVDDVSFGAVSFNVAYHLGDRSKTTRVDPFLNVSPGFYFQEGSGGFAFGLGGGLNFWIKDRVGLRAELRLQSLGTEEALALIRVGLTLR